MLSVFYEVCLCLAVWEPEPDQGQGRTIHAAVSPQTGHTGGIKNGRWDSEDFNMGPCGATLHRYEPHGAGDTGDAPDCDLNSCAPVVMIVYPCKSAALTTRTPLIFNIYAGQKRKI